MWILAAFGSAFFAGCTAILAKIGIKKTDSNLATALRTCVVLVFAWLMAWITGGIGDLTSISGRTLLFLGLSGATTGASWLCYFRALKLGDVNKVTPVDKSSTVLTMLLAALFLQESLNWLKWVCMAAILVGTLLMLDKKTGGKTKSKVWLLYAVLSAVFAAMTSILGKIGISGVNSNLGTALRTCVVLVFAWLMVWITGKAGEIKRIDGKSWLFLLLSGLATGMSWLCYYYALQNGQASIVAPIDKLSLLITVAFSVLVLKEKLSAKAWIGLGLVTAGTLALLL